jgi:hypothetical protein
MSSNRRAVKPSEWANVTIKSKKARSSTRGFIKAVKSVHYATFKKYQCRNLTVALKKTFCPGFEHIKVNAQNLTFYFIKCSLVILYYT